MLWGLQSVTLNLTIKGVTGMPGYLQIIIPNAAGPDSSWLTHRKTKHWMPMFGARRGLFARQPSKEMRDLIPNL